VVRVTDSVTLRARAWLREVPFEENL
jgi:hypothetical protein